MYGCVETSHRQQNRDCFRQTDALYCDTNRETGTVCYSRNDDAMEDGIDGRLLFFRTGNGERNEVVDAPLVVGRGTYGYYAPTYGGGLPLRPPPFHIRCFALEFWRSLKDGNLGSLQIFLYDKANK